jgi:hypothetical protein
VQRIKAGLSWKHVADEGVDIEAVDLALRSAS